MKHWLYSDSLTASEEFADVGGLLSASYRFPANDEVSAREIAVQIASGQTLGFLSDDRVYAHYLGRILSVEHEADQAHATIGFPGHLCGSDVAGILTLAFGKISFFPKIKLCDLDGDEVFLKKFKGPKFGFHGIQEKLFNPQFPALMAILKPGIGPLPLIAENFAALMGAGVDIVKDDEICIDSSLDKTLKRLATLSKLCPPGKIYVQHLTAPAHQLLNSAVTLQENGAKAFLFCPLTFGWSALQDLCQSPAVHVPIFVHPALAGIYGEGIAYSLLLGKLMRWAGADAVLYPSPYGSIALQKTTALSIHAELLDGNYRLKQVASVPSAGITTKDVARIAQDFGRDVIVNAGTGMAKGFKNLAEGVGKFRDEISKHF